jgi:hypothetical protein
MAQQQYALAFQRSGKLPVTPPIETIIQVGRIEECLRSSPLQSVPKAKQDFIG